MTSVLSDALVRDLDEMLRWWKRQVLNPLNRQIGSWEDSGGGSGGTDHSSYINDTTLPDNAMLGGDYCDPLKRYVQPPTDHNPTLSALVDSSVRAAMTAWYGKSGLYPSGMCYANPNDIEMGAYDATPWLTKPTALWPHVMYASPSIMPRPLPIEKLLIFYHALPVAFGGDVLGVTDQWDFWGHAGTLRLGIYDTISDSDLRPGGLLAQTAELAFDTEYPRWLWGGQAIAPDQLQFPLGGQLFDAANNAISSFTQASNKLYWRSIVWRPTRNSSLAYSDANKADLEPPLLKPHLLHVAGGGQRQKWIVFSRPDADSPFGFSSGDTVWANATVTDSVLGSTYGKRSVPSGSANFHQVSQTGNCVRSPVDRSADIVYPAALYSADSAPPKIDPDASAYYWDGRVLPLRWNLSSAPPSCVNSANDTSVGGTVSNPDSPGERWGADTESSFGTPYIYAKVANTDNALAYGCAGDTGDGTDPPDVGCVADDSICMRFEYKLRKYQGRIDESGGNVYAKDFNTYRGLTYNAVAFARLTRVYPPAGFPVTYVGGITVNGYFVASAGDSSDSGIVPFSFPVKVVLQSNVCDGPPPAFHSASATFGASGATTTPAMPILCTPSAANPFHLNLPQSGSPLKAFILGAAGNPDGSDILTCYAMEFTGLGDSGIYEGSCDYAVDFPDTGLTTDININVGGFP